MNSIKDHIEVSYRISITILVLLTVAILAVIWVNSIELARLMFKLPVVSSGILGCVGTALLVKGNKEPMTEKKIIALTVNLGMVLLCCVIVFVNLLDS